jgi:hypothetical protein
MVAETAFLPIEATDMDPLTDSSGEPYIGILVESAPGRASLLPAERHGKEIQAVVAAEPLFSGATDPGADLWATLRRSGWKWVQDGPFGQKYWRRDTLERDPIQKKPRRK